jgi:hypothetical protein
LAGCSGGKSGIRSSDNAYFKYELNRILALAEDERIVKLDLNSSSFNPVQMAEIRRIGNELLEMSNGLDGFARRNSLNPE